MPTIEELKEDMGYCRRNYEDAKKRYYDALIDVYPFKVGDIIKSSNGTLAKVIAVTVPYGEMPYAYAVLQKKDGSFGKMRAGLWRPEWKNPELVERS